MQNINGYSLTDDINSKLNCISIQAESINIHTKTGKVEFKSDCFKEDSAHRVNEIIINGVRFIREGLYDNRKHKK